MNAITENKLNQHPEIEIKDSLGRKIVIKKPNRLQVVNYRLACGAKRKALLEEIFILPWVQSIEGQKIPSPVALIDVKNLIQTLDHEGYEAVVIAASEQVNKKDKEQSVKKDG